MKNNSPLARIPVLAAFFIMGFCDVVGISTSYVKQDFALSETLAGFIPSMVFIWFLVLSVPAALAMNRIGRKRMVQISNIVTIVGLLIPFISYNFLTCMIAFVLLGVGNTLLQVSLNPLLTNVVKGERLTSYLTAGQVIKAVSSFSGPFIALFAAKALGSWKYLFPIFALLTLISWCLLGITRIEEESSPESQNTSVASAFSLLKNKEILLCFLGICFLVGIDVGTNTVSAKLLMERCGLDVENASLGASVYFICRTVGAFLGTFLLARIPEVRYMRVNMILAAASMALLFLASSTLSVCLGLGLMGFFCSSIFAIIFSIALKSCPERANEVSGFMITGVCGGAVIPPLMGVMTDLVGNQAGSLIVISICVIYLLLFAFRLKPQVR